MNQKIKLYSTLVIIILFTTLLSLYSTKFLKLFSLLLTASAIGVLAFKFIMTQMHWRIANYLEEPVINYNRREEKYRTVVQMTFFPLAILSLFQLSRISINENFQLQLFQFIVCNLLSFVCALIISFTWTKKFSINIQNPSTSKKELISKEQEFLSARDFYLSLSESELKSFYEKMIHHDIITCLVEDNNKNDNDLFLDIFFHGKTPEKPTFRLNLDHIQSKLFFEELKKFEVSGKRKFTLKIFSQIFTNKNGIIVPKNLSSSNSKADNLPKNSDLLISLFEFDKKS